MIATRAVLSSFGCWVWNQRNAGEGVVVAPSFELPPLPVPGWPLIFYKYRGSPPERWAAAGERKVRCRITFWGLQWLLAALARL